MWITGLFLSGKTFINLFIKNKMSKNLIKPNCISSFAGHSRSKIYLEIKAGKFPLPVRFGSRAVGWPESDLDEFLDKLIEAGRPEIH